MLWCKTQRQPGLIDWVEGLRVDMNAEQTLNAPDPVDDEIDLGRLLSQLWAGRWSIFLMVFLFGAISVGYLMTTPPTYQADSLLQLEEKGGQLALPDALAGLTSETPKSVAEIEIAQSRMVLGEVVAELKLDWVAEPRLVPVVGYALRQYPLPIPEVAFLAPFGRMTESIRLDLLETPPEWVSKEIEVIADGVGGFSVLLPNEAQVAGRVGETLRLVENGFALRIGALVAGKGRSFVLMQRSEGEAIESLRGSLTISEKGRQSGIIEMRFTDEDPRKAQQILDAVTRSYLNQNVARSSAEAESSLGFISDQLPEAEAAVNKAEADLNEYRQSQQSVDLALEAQSLLTQVTRLENELEALQLQEDELSQRYTPSHPLYQTLLNNRAALETRLEGLRLEVDALPSTQRDIINLTRDLEVAQTVYTQLLNRQQELQVLRASNIGNVRIIDSARTAPDAIAPRRAMILALALLLGGMFGAGYVLVRQWMRQGVQGADELEQLGLPVFTTVNFMSGVERAAKGKGAIPIHAIANPDDLTTEAFRSLRTSLHFGMLDAETRSIALTGAGPGAGKSFCAVNLAAVTALSGQKVCLVDADLRRGYLRRFFNVPKNQAGLAEVLSGKAALNDVLVEGPIPDLMFLPTGRYPPNPSELLMRPAFAEMIKELDQRFALTICDAPPVLAVTDPVVIGRAVGAMIAVVRYDETPIGEIQALMRATASAGVRITGAILNAYDPKRAKGRDGYNYTYRYDYQSRKD